MRAIRLTVIVLLLVTLGVRSAAAERRLALVIGNAGYRHTAALDNPVGDARLMAATLRRQGFAVALHEDLDQRAMKRAVAAFFGDVGRAPRDAVVVIYYAGHGLQVRGANYLVPVDAEISQEGDVDVEAVKVDSIMEQIAFAGSALNIVILDACRNNPFRGFRSVTRGLAQVDAPGGTLVAFSTAPGRVARDGPKGANSPYTAELAKAIAVPGLRIEDVFKRVRVAVNNGTKGEQIPWESSSLVGDFYPAGKASGALSAGPGAQPGASAGERLSEAATAWAAIGASRNPAVLAAFIEQFPGTVYAAMARERLGDVAQGKGVLPAAPASSPQQASARADAHVRAFAMKPQTGINGDLLDSRTLPEPGHCRALCDETAGCVAFDHSRSVNRCNLYRRVINLNAAANWTAGVPLERPRFARGSLTARTAIAGDLLDSAANSTLEWCGKKCSADDRCAAYDFNDALNRCNLYARVIALQSAQGSQARVVRDH